MSVLENDLKPAESRLSNEVLINISNIKNPINETLFNADNDVMIRNKPFQINSPVFKFIINNPNADFIPSELLNTYNGEFNLSSQTPLMLASIIGNVNFVKQLIRIDIGHLDVFNKCALDYANEFDSSQEVKNILEEYELS